MSLSLINSYKNTQATPKATRVTLGSTASEFRQAALEMLSAGSSLLSTSARLTHESATAIKDASDMVSITGMVNAVAEGGSLLNGFVRGTFSSLTYKEYSAIKTAYNSLSKSEKLAYLTNKGFNSSQELKTYLEDSLEDDVKTEDI